MTANLSLDTHPVDNLALAVVASSDAPIVLLDGDLKVVAASQSFCRAFQIDPRSVDGRPLLFDLGDGEWDVPQLRSLLKATLAGVADIEAYEMDLKRADMEPRRLVLRAHTLSYGAPTEVRMMLAVSDVTDARLAAQFKDDLLREKATLLLELQHRVANSLQIIASVLLQSARRAGAGETQATLYDAHSRVVSVAALQRHLAASPLGDVGLRAYFTELCETIGASMINDRTQLRLLVVADDSVASADVSVSLGLIVTELVINALKHAFPDGRKGKIAVDYDAEGPSWALTVFDDGIGMRAGGKSTKAGLGTSIVEALAKQLHASVQIADAKPGVVVSVLHA